MRANDGEPALDGELAEIVAILTTTLAEIREQVRRLRGEFAEDEKDEKDEKDEPG